MHWKPTKRMDDIDFDVDIILSDGEEEPNKNKKSDGTPRKSFSNIKSQQHQRSSKMIWSGTEMITCVRNHIVQAKCFRNEVRAVRDVESFLENPLVLLNVHGASVEDIIEKMIEKIAGNNEGCSSTLDLQPIRNSIYSQDNGFQFRNFIQGVYYGDDHGRLLVHDTTWCCVYASVDSLIQTRKVIIARLSNPTNFGPTLNSVSLIVLILVPTKEKSSKNSFEIARTFATLFSDALFRNSMLDSGNDEKRFVQILSEKLERLKSSNQIVLEIDEIFKCVEEPPIRLQFSCGKGIRENLVRRLGYYWSDYRDGLDNLATLSKVCSSTISLFFACILPCVAFGVLNEHNTNGKIGPKEALLGQTIGGLAFALFSGQPLVIIATTAPLCLYTTIVHHIAKNLSVNFFDLFAMVGIWNAFFCIIYSLFDLSQLMYFCTRSTEEIFATFIFFAFTIDSIKQCISSFQENYCFINHENGTLLMDSVRCAPEKSILFLFLMSGTFVLGIMLHEFSATSYLSSFFRFIIADYSLPLSVIIFALIGSYAFADVKPDSFEVTVEYRWRVASLSTLNIKSIFFSLVLGFSLSMLFFIDQNISAALVASPANRLKKGDAYHWDLLLTAILNIGLSLIGFPWMHGILPHSPMHARSLADVVVVGEFSTSIDGFGSSSKQNRIVVRSRETRVTGILAHVLIGLVTIYIPWILNFIPVAVLSGLFLYCAASTLRENSLYERVLLFLTEQTSYPPAHYLRKCPQKIVHLFTFIQLLQLGIICFFGFSPWEYVQLIFPLIIACLIPIRWMILPRFIGEHYLSIIDNKSY